MPVVFAGNLPRGYRKDELLDFLAKFPPDEVSLKTEYAFLTYFEKVDAEDVIHRYHGEWFAGNRIILEKQRGKRSRHERSYVRSPRRPQRFQRRVQGKYYAVIVDIPNECSWQDLKDFARDYGAPRSITTEVVRRDGSRTGLLAFRCERDMDEAVNCLDGKKVRPGRGAPHSYKPAIVHAFPEIVRSESRSWSSRGSYGRSRSRSRPRRNRSRSPSSRRTPTPSPYRRGDSLSRSVHRRRRSRSRSHYRYATDLSRSRSRKFRSRSKSYKRTLRSLSRTKDDKRYKTDDVLSEDNRREERRRRSKSRARRRDRGRSERDCKSYSKSEERPNFLSDKDQIQKLSHTESLKREGRTSERRNKDSGAIVSPAQAKTHGLSWIKEEGLQEYPIKREKEKGEE